MVDHNRWDQGMEFNKGNIMYFSTTLTNSLECKKAADPIADKYFEWANTFSKSDAQKKLQDLTAYTEHVMAKAEERERRAQGNLDGTAIERAYEKTSEQRNQIELLKWFIQNPTRKPPKELLDEFESIAKDKAEAQKYKIEQREKFKKFDDLVGKRIWWKSTRTNQTMTAIVIKQKPGKWEDAPVYITDSGWTVPHKLVLKIVTPRNDDTLERLQKKKDLQVGQMVEWNSKKSHEPKGKVTNVGRTKVQVQVADGGIWTVPMTLITKIDGKAV